MFDWGHPKIVNTDNPVSLKKWPTIKDATEQEKKSSLPFSSRQALDQGTQKLLRMIPLNPDISAQHEKLQIFVGLHRAFTQKIGEDGSAQ